MKKNKKFIILCIYISFINQITQTRNAQPVSFLTRKAHQNSPETNVSQNPENDCNQITPERCQFFAKILRGDHMDDIADSEVIPKDYTLPNGMTPVRFALDTKNTHAVVNLVSQGYTLTPSDWEFARSVYCDTHSDQSGIVNFFKKKYNQIYNFVLIEFLRRNLDPTLLKARGRHVIDFNAPQAQLVTAARNNDVLLLWEMLEHPQTNPNTRFLAEEPLESALFHQNINASTLLLDDPRTIVTPNHQRTLFLRASLLEASLHDRDPYPGNAQHPDREISYDQDLQELAQLEARVIAKIQEQNRGMAIQSKIPTIIQQRQLERQERQRQQEFDDLLRRHLLRQQAQQSNNTAAAVTVSATPRKTIREIVAEVRRQLAQTEAQGKK